MSSYKSIIRNRFSSVAHFIVLIEYLFLCTPILLNYIFGIPTYEYIPWYKTFISSMHDDLISIIYDLYITISVVAIYLYAKKFDANQQKSCYFDEVSKNDLFNNGVFCFLVISTPLIYILGSGKIGHFLMYATADTRGIDDAGFTTVLSALVLLSIYTFSYRLFSSPLTISKFFILIVFARKWVVRISSSVLNSCVRARLCTIICILAVLL